MAQGDKCTCGYCPAHGGISFHINHVVGNEIDWDRIVGEKIIPAIERASSRNIIINSTVDVEENHY